MKMHKVTPFLWLEGRAEEAARLYVSLFDDAEIVETGDTPPTDGDADPQPWSVTFRIGDQRFIAFNGGPHYALSPAYSMHVDCADQDEIDRLWKALTDGGEESRCGWLVDRFGVSWQLIPSELESWLSGGGDPVRAKRVMDAMLGMQKLDIAELRAAYDG
jgi:predicted 3-demethylubiquinone-9 3-methyltransferase (glyoxalase superfamily)